MMEFTLIVRRGFKMKDKKVILTFNNPEAKMKLTVEGPNAVKNSLKIMKAFDDACDEIKEAGDDWGK